MFCTVIGRSVYHLSSYAHSMEGTAWRPRSNIELLRIILTLLLLFEVITSLDCCSIIKCFQCSWHGGSL
jgi:hypothetical protein